MFFNTSLKRNTFITTVNSIVTSNNTLFKVLKVEKPQFYFKKVYPVQEVKGEFKVKRYGLTNTDTWIWIYERTLLVLLLPFKYYCWLVLIPVRIPNVCHVKSWSVSECLFSKSLDLFLTIITEWDRALTDCSAVIVTWQLKLQKIRKRWSPDFSTFLKNYI